MKTKTSMLITLLLVGVLALAACGGNTAETEPAEAGEVVTMYVGPELAECTGEGPQTCMMIKETPDGEYQYFYSQIEGFTYEAGYEYELKVQVTPVENPPAGGSSLQYTLVEQVSKTPAAEAAESDVVTMYVGPELVECTGVAPQTCMQVKYSPDEAYQFFYGQIEGFTFEEGYEYELKVQVTPVENPPADGSSLQYTLVEEVSKTPAAEASESDVVTMYVGPELVECTGVAPQTCMQVKYSPDEAYQFFYGQIEGFTFEEGYDYELKVAVSDVENPPADGSSLKYTLVEEVSKTPAGAEASTMPATEAVGDATLTGTFWTLSTYAGADGTMVNVLPETDVTAVFGEDSSLAGSSGCNNYNTSYTIDGSTISISDVIAATMMMCPEPIMQQETAYLANLTTAVTFAIAGDTLTLSDATGNATAVFIAKQPTALVGTQWQVQSYNTGTQAVTGVIGGTSITAVFGEDGNMSGNASCNTYNVPYEVDGSSITIGVGMSTMMACPGEGVMEQETAYLAAITTAATFSIQGDILELRTADGALAVSYVAVEPTGLAAMPWMVTSYNNGRDAAVSPLLDTELTLEFQEDGNITGNAGCNRYFGPYVITGDSLQIGPLATTRALCPEPAGIMEQEQEFLAALQAAATFTIQNDKLDIRMADGAIAVLAIPSTP